MLTISLFASLINTSFLFFKLSCFNQFIFFFSSLFYASFYQPVRFKAELERNITIKLGYANAKIYKCTNPDCPAPGYVHMLFLTLSISISIHVLIFFLVFYISFQLSYHRYFSFHIYIRFTLINFLKPYFNV